MDKNIYAGLHSVAALAMGGSCVAGGFITGAAYYIFTSSTSPSMNLIKAGMALTAVAWIIVMNTSNVVARTFNLGQCSPKAVSLGCASGFITLLVTPKIRLCGKLLCEPFVPHLTILATIGVAYLVARQSYEQQN